MPRTRAASAPYMIGGRPVLLAIISTGDLLAQSVLADETDPHVLVSQLRSLLSALDPMAAGSANQPPLALVT